MIMLKMLPRLSAVVSTIGLVFLSQASLAAVYSYDFSFTDDVPGITTNQGSVSGQFSYNTSPAFDLVDQGIPPASISITSATGSFLPLLTFDWSNATVFVAGDWMEIGDTGEDTYFNFDFRGAGGKPVHDLSGPLPLHAFVANSRGSSITVFDEHIMAGAFSWGGDPWAQVTLTLATGNVPLPGSVWLFLTALTALIGSKKSKEVTKLTIKKEF